MISNKDTTYALSFLQYQSTMSAEAAIMQIEILLRQKKLDVAAKVADYVFGIIRLNLTYYLESDQAFLVAVIAKYQASKNNSEIASQYFDKAIAIDRENSFCYLERGKFYLARRKKQLAKQDLKKAADLGQNEAKILLARLK